MSAVICQTVQSTFSVPPHAKMHGPLHWPSGSTRERNNKPPALRIVASESSPSLPHHDSDSMAVTPARSPHTHASSSRVNSTDAPNVKRHQQHNAGERAEVPFPGRPSAHPRTQSTSVIGESSADLGSCAVRPHRRTRAASSPGIERRARPRLPSMLATVLTQNKAPAQPRESTNDPELLGSFTPTSSPRPRLRSLLFGTNTPPEFSGAPSSSFSSPSQLPTPTPRRPSALRVGHSYGTEPRRRRQSDAPRARVGIGRHWRSASASEAPPPIDPPGSPDLPSICRTPSSYSSSDYFTTTPSSAGPTTPVHTGVVLPIKPDGRKSEASSLHPVLENLEQTSMFRVLTACATCGKRGSNFPCCPKCGEMWCSRPCRLQKGNGKRHICSKHTV
ncbi:hypothetical protein LXA43DRAFT_1152487 [Ganoderma leucocontextum]|nr:hypothetical protein LXA43DRAFT_1152487 [Ganoderma leucocontextum]